jgi:hypothetical protein
MGRLILLQQPLYTGNLAEDSVPEAYTCSGTPDTGHLGQTPEPNWGLKQPTSLQEQRVSVCTGYHSPEDLHKDKEQGIQLFDTCAPSQVLCWQRCHCHHCIQQWTAVKPSSKEGCSAACKWIRNQLVWQVHTRKQECSRTRTESTPHQQRTRHAHDGSAACIAG